MTEYEKLCIKYQEELTQAEISGCSRKIEGADGYFTVPGLHELFAVLANAGEYILIYEKPYKYRIVFSLPNKNAKRIAKASTLKVLVLKAIAIINEW